MPEGAAYHDHQMSDTYMITTDVLRGIDLQEFHWMYDVSSWCGGSRLFFLQQERLRFRLYLDVCSTVFRKGAHNAEADFWTALWNDHWRCLLFDDTENMGKVGGGPLVTDILAPDSSPLSGLWQAGL